MSGTSASAHGGLGYAHVAAKWGWFVALGVALIAAGFFALGDVVATTLISVIFIGAALLVGGVAQGIHAFVTKTWASFAFNLVCALLYIVAGVMIMQEPVQGSLFVTIIVLVMFVLGGITRIVIGLRHRDLPGWWLLALGGVFSVIVGIMLYASLPWSGLRLLGTLVGFELLIHGVTWLRLGLALRSMRRLASAR